MEPKEAADAVGHVIDSVPEINRPEFFGILVNRYPDLGSMMLMNNVCYVPTPTPPVNPVEALLTVEQREYAETVKKAMSDKLEINIDNLRLLQLKTKEEELVAIVMDGGPNGQKIGNDKNIAEKRLKDPNWYKIVVNGKLLDMLTHTTDAAYRAMIVDAKTRGVSPLPDSLALSKQYGKPWTWTMLTGEKLAINGQAQFRYVSGTTVRRETSDFGHLAHNRRVRASVLIGMIIRPNINPRKR